MSHDTTPLINAPDDSSTDGPDLSHFLAGHHVALHVVMGPHRGAEYPIRRERTVLGRSRKVDLAFDEDTLSREHAVIRYEQGRFVLEDLGSANGCLHNGLPVSEIELAHGDMIEMGRVRMGFVLEAREPDPQTHLLEADR